MARKLIAKIMSHNVEASPDISFVNDTTNPHPPNITHAIAIKNPLTLITEPPNTGIIRENYYEINYNRREPFLTIVDDPIYFDKSDGLT